MPREKAETFEQLYARLEATMTAAKVRSFVRYYEIPGQGHVTGAFATAWDSVKALEDCKSSLKYGSLPDAYRKQLELTKRLETLGSKF